MTTRTDSPEVDFNIDSYKSAEELKPYAIVFGGKRYEMTHMDELDGWSVAEAFTAGDAGADIEIIKLSLGEAKFAEFKKESAGKLKRGPMQELIKRYLAHCGLSTGK
jgi:hypothetical protein